MLREMRPESAEPNLSTEHLSPKEQDCHLRGQKHVWSARRIWTTTVDALLLSSFMWFLTSGFSLWQEVGGFNWLLSLYLCKDRRSCLITHCQHSLHELIINTLSKKAVIAQHVFQVFIYCCLWTVQITVLHFKTPLYQYSQFKHNLESYTYATRQATEGRFSPPKANTHFFKRTRLYRAMKAWNSWPLTMTKLTKKSMFQK